MAHVLKRSAKSGEDKMHPEGLNAARVEQGHGHSKVHLLAQKLTLEYKDINETFRQKVSHSLENLQNKGVYRPFQWQL